MQLNFFLLQDGNCAQASVKKMSKFKSLRIMDTKIKVPENSLTKNIIVEDHQNFQN